MQTISVVIAVRNGARTLQRCIDSIRNQSYPLKELVIVDGMSTDGTRDILAKNDEIIASWTSEPDTGIYHAWNKALARAKGDWICFLGADDYFWDSQVLEHMAPHLAGAYPPVRVVYGEVALLNEAGQMLGRFGKPWPEMRSDFLRGEALNIHQATFHHRSLFEQRGGFDETFHVAGDYELLLRELQRNKAIHVPCLVAAMQHGGVSSNPANKMKTNAEVRRAMRLNALQPGLRLRMAWFRAMVHAAMYRVAGERISGLVADGYRHLTGKGRLWTASGDDTAGKRRAHDKRP